MEAISTDQLTETILAQMNQDVLMEIASSFGAESYHRLTMNFA